MPSDVESVARRYEAIRPHLNERQRRLWLGNEARELGSGGARIVFEATAVAQDVIRRGREELDDPQPLPVFEVVQRAGAVDGPAQNLLQGVPAKR